MVIQTFFIVLTNFTGLARVYDRYDPTQNKVSEKTQRRKIYKAA